MNIFVLDRDPRAAARAHCDKHVGKLLIESVQLLSTVALQHGGAAPYRASHAAHPCTRWVAASRSNWLWLVELARGLDEEFTLRFGKRHASGVALAAVSAPPPTLPDVGLTPHAQAMPAEFRVEGDAVAAYRRYYRGAKAGFARWDRGRSEPAWWAAP